MNNSTEVSYHEYKRPRALLRLWGAWSSRDLIRRNKKTHILVLLHLYYDQSWKEIKQYLLNLGPYQCDLIVTTTNGRISQMTINDIKAFTAMRTRIIPVPNKGFDLGPFFEALRSVDDQYDVIFKLHSKGTKRRAQYIYDQLFFRRTWFLNLYRGLLSSRNAHTTVDRLVHDKNTRIVAASNLIISDPTYKQKTHMKIGRSLGIELNSHYLYVAGTCFAMNADQFAAISQLPFSIRSFENTDEFAIWDLAHFLERAICVVGNQKQCIAGNPTCRLHHMLCAPLCWILRRVLPLVKRLSGRPFAR